MAPRCQCTSACSRPPLKGEAFCKEHATTCPVASPLSGYEPAYKPGVYNNQADIKDNNNCFAYAFLLADRPTQKNVPFHQPGLSAGFPKWSKIKGKRCPDLIARLKGDMPDIQMTTFEGTCPKGTSKVAVTVNAESDYHFYRQDQPKRGTRKAYWSHKPGSTEVTRRDATGHLVYNPELADRDYTFKNDGLHYDHFCGFLCAPRTRKLAFKRGGRSTRKASKARK